MEHDKESKCQRTTPEEHIVRLSELEKFIEGNLQICHEILDEIVGAEPPEPEGKWTESYSQIETLQQMATDNVASVQRLVRRLRLLSYKI